MERWKSINNQNKRKHKIITTGTDNGEETRGPTNMEHSNRQWDHPLFPLSHPIFRSHLLLSCNDTGFWLAPNVRSTLTLYHLQLQLGRQLNAVKR